MDLLVLCWLQAGVLLFQAREGVSLECEICQSVSNTCQGPTRACPPVFDTCGIVIMGGKMGFKGIDKICTHSRACNQSYTRINVGKEIAVWSRLVCCVGKECKRKSPTLPYVDITLNGKQCPASVVTKHQEFKEEIIRCGGDEIYCFELTGNATTPTVSLECETCHSLENQTCNGSMEICKPHYDKCAIALSKSLTEHITIVKTCVSSSQCETPLNVLNTGKGRKTLTKIFCCSGNECKNISSSFPPINVTSNGKKCKACYYWGNGECPEKMVECSGEEIYCLELFGTGETGRHIIPITIKGCVNKAICDGFVKGPLSMGGVTIGGEAKCTPASRIDNPIPSLFGLILPVIILLLLVKVQP